MSGTGHTPNLAVAARQLADMQRRMSYIEYQLGKSPLRILPPSRGGPVAVFAQVTQTLQRADVLADPPVEERCKYKIRFTEETIDDWAAGVGYKAGDIVKVPTGDDYVYFKCNVAHTSNSDNATTANTGLWEPLEDDIEAGVVGYTGNLLETVPWYCVGDMVEVVQRNGQWLIKSTAVRTEDNGNYSILWDPEAKRAKAVFK